jgi:hypothetical protein
MSEQSSALPGREGSGRGHEGRRRDRKWAIPCKPAPLAPSAGGALEARMLTSQESPVLIIGGLVALRLAWGFCCVWLERSRRKTTLAVMNTLIAWERERKKL